MYQTQGSLCYIVCLLWKCWRAGPEIITGLLRYMCPPNCHILVEIEEKTLDNFNYRAIRRLSTGYPILETCMEVLQIKTNCLLLLYYSNINIQALKLLCSPVATGGLRPSNWSMKHYKSNVKPPGQTQSPFVENFLATVLLLWPKISDVRLLPNCSACLPYLELFSRYKYRFVDTRSSIYLQSNDNENYYAFHNDTCVSNRWLVPFAFSPIFLFCQ